MRSSGDPALRSAQNTRGVKDAELNIGSHHKNRQPCTVDEALAYTPLASVVPFTTGIVPFPSVGVRASPSLLSRPSQLDSARQELKVLNEQATAPRGSSQHVEQTLLAIQGIIKPEALTEYKFRSPATKSRRQNVQKGSKTYLSPFAQLVYDSTNIAFKSISSEGQPSRPSKAAVSLMSPSQQSSEVPKTKNVTPAKIPNAVLNGQAYNQNSFNQNTRIEVRIPSYNPLTPSKKLVTPPNPSPSLSNPGSIIKVVLPKASQVLKTEEYTPHPIEPLTPSSNHPKKRKRSEPLDEDNFLGRGSDQREKAEAAFRGLQELLQEIFEAEDQFRTDGMNTSLSGEYLVVTSDDVLSLTGPAQAKLDTLVTKLISLGKFGQVPVDDLVRLQKLCEPSIKATETVIVSIDESWEEADVDVWMQKLMSAESGLKSARSSLRLMTGGREEKKLYSEDIILSSVNAFRNIMDACMIPVTEMRCSGPASRLFKILLSRRKDINSLLSQCLRLLSILRDVISSIDLSDSVINTLEFTVSQLIFVENAHVEKDSVLGVQRFDGIRVAAMDVLAQIFLSYPSQRRGIFDEILTSLEKLPVAKQSARQFKLVEGGSIQLVSALIMRLVQTSANKPDEGKQRRKANAFHELARNENAEADNTGSGDPYSKGSAAVNPANDTERRAFQQSDIAIQELKKVISPLIETASGNARLVVSFIIERAMKSTKTGDAPYRNLLDLFVQDFITCLTSTDWPAAELLLRVFLVTMVRLAESDKTPAPAKNMALDVLSEMAVAISQLHSQVKKPAGSLEGIDAATELGAHLLVLAEGSLEAKVRATDLVAWLGPYRAALEYLEQRCCVDSALQSAIDYYMIEWALQLVESHEDEVKKAQPDAEYGKVAYRLRKMITEKNWLRTEYNIQPLSIGYARLGHSLTLTSSKFSNGLDRIIKILLDCMRSEQATVRSKALKSINQVLEINPTILDRYPGIVRVITDCSSDPSVAVRDSALGLIGKCIGLKPQLEKEMTPAILQRVSDAGSGVRKRAIRLLKDLYLKNETEDVRSSVADSLLQRVTDHDSGVQDLARQTIEEIWMQPLYVSVSAADDESVPYKLKVVDQVQLMVRTVQRRSEGSGVLDKVLQNMLSNDSKHSAANFRVCRTLVATMFETIIDNSDGKTSETQDALQLLMIFAKANAKLFTPGQIQLLPPYITELKNDEIGRFRSIVVIFRHTFPQLSMVHHKFLEEVRGILLKVVVRASKVLLDDIAACLWTISTVLENSFNIATLTASSLLRCSELSKIPNLGQEEQASNVRMLIRLLLICGTFGKHCDLDDQAAIFRKRFPTWKNSSVSKLLVDTFAPLASPSQPEELREAALDAIGMVCQSWPKNFSSVNIYTTFQQVFAENIRTLESKIMRSFRDFLISEEKRSEPGAEAIVGAGAQIQATLGVMGGSQHDGVATEIAQKFLKDITRIALASQDEHALLATEILTSINRQGMNHPKECGPALVALETSQNAAIADLAFREHRTLHEKHETILEKEYMRAVQYAFAYQRDIVRDTRGANTHPYTAKLHLMMEVLKISKVKTRKRFFESLCTRIDFDPAKLDVQEALPAHIEFSRFVIENMAFFDYHSIDELQAAIAAMEKVVAGTGTTVAHAIETEIFKVQLQETSQPLALECDINSITTVPSLDAARLRQLTAASMILSGLWEARTYLRRAFGLLTGRREVKGKPAAKDLNRAPVKTQGASGDKFWEDVTKIMASLSSPLAMMDQCKSFVELLTLDKDFKVAVEGEDDLAHDRPNTPSVEDGEDMPAPTSGRGRKRKATSTPSKKKLARSSSIGRSKKMTRGGIGSGEDAEGEWE